MSSLRAGWTTASLGELTAAGRPICYGILMPKEHVEDGVPYVRVKDFPKDIINTASLRRTAPEIAQKYQRSSLQAGDVLVSIRGTYGRVAITPTTLQGGNITQDTARVSPSNAVLNSYLAYFLRSEIAQRYFGRVARGVAVKGVNIGDLKRLPCPVAPFQEQVRIVAAIEEQFSRLDQGENLLRSAYRRTDRLRASVLATAVRGDWPTKRLGDIATTASGGTPSRKHPEYFEGDIPWAKSGELRDGIVTSTDESISELGLSNSSAKIFKRGTLLIAMYGATVGKLGLLGIDAATNQAVCAVMPHEPEMTPYLHTVLRQKRQELVDAAQGGAQPNISQAILRELTVPVPPITEQVRIVAEVERQLTLLDSLIPCISHALARSGILRRAILERAFTGQLVAQDPANQPASELIARTGTRESAAQPKQLRKSR